jgi:DNA-binding CsgD family transcriptional regulator
MNMNIPAGIINSLELFRIDGEPFAMLDGHKCKYTELPMLLKLPFQNELYEDFKAQEALITMRISAKDMEEKFIACRYGNYDNTPDLIDGKPIHDAPKCSEMDTCKGFGKVCKIPGGLSKKEYLIVREIARGLLDKEIAQHCNVELSTIRTFLSRIREKLNVNNRNEIASWAHSLNIN